MVTQVSWVWANLNFQPYCQLINLPSKRRHAHLNVKLPALIQKSKCTISTF